MKVLFAIQIWRPFFLLLTLVAKIECLTPVGERPLALSESVTVPDIEFANLNIRSSTTWPARVCCSLGTLSFCWGTVPEITPEYNTSLNNNPKHGQ